MDTLLVRPLALAQEHTRSRDDWQGRSATVLDRRPFLCMSASRATFCSLCVIQFVFHEGSLGGKKTLYMHGEGCSLCARKDMPRRTSLGLAIVLIFRLLFSETHARSNAAYCFPATPGVSDCLAGRFDQFWGSSGGLPVFGFPITPLYDAPTREGLVLAQMVERNRLEYHPDLAPPYDILLGRLGEDLLVARGRDWRADPVGLPKMDCWYVEETEHTVCDQEPELGFLSY